jgi:hypothetical protein
VMTDVPAWTGEGQLWKNLSVYRDGSSVRCVLSNSTIGYIQDRVIPLPDGTDIPEAIREVQRIDLLTYNELD